MNHRSENTCTERANERKCNFSCVEKFCRSDEEERRKQTAITRHGFYVCENTKEAKAAQRACGAISASTPFHTVVT